jgi:hypothetical protein
MEDVFFNTSAFWRWFFYAVWQGILLAYLVVYTFDTAEIENGWGTGMILEGNYIFYAIVVLVNVKILISSFEYTFWMLFWISISIIGYWICFSIASTLFLSSELYGL